MEPKTEPDITIDAVAMTRRIRDAQHARLESLSWEERVAYYREQSQTLLRRLGVAPDQAPVVKTP